MAAEAQRADEKVSPTPSPSSPKPSADPGISVVIPVYNEVDSVAETLQNVHEHLEASGLTYEVVAVNDGSTDGTSKVFAELELPNINKVAHPQNRGYGAALKTGIKNATYDYIVITDADGTYPNERMAEFVAEMIETKSDMLVGARVGENVEIPLIRKPAKKALNELANYLSQTQIPDLNSGFRVMKKDVVKRFLHLLPDSFSFTTTITLAMLSDGFKVKYTPIDYFHRQGNSKIKPIQDTVRFTQLVIRTVMYFNPLRVFVPLSMGLFVASLIMLLVRLFSGGGLLAASLILFVSAIQVLTTGMLADLIVKTNAGRRNAP